MAALPEKLTIRVASSDDLPTLDRGVPTKGGGNAHRLERSLAGESALLLAFVGGEAHDFADSCRFLTRALP
jgi:hypothetical protein